MTDDPPTRRIDPVVEAYKAGIDTSLLAEQLRRTPTERVQAMMAMLQLSEALRAARCRGDASEDPPPDYIGAADPSAGGAPEPSAGASPEPSATA